MDKIRSCTDQTQEDMTCIDLIITYVFASLKLHDIVIDTYTHVSCQLKNVNIIMIKQKCKYLFFYVSFDFFFGCQGVIADAVHD